MGNLSLSQVRRTRTGLWALAIGLGLSGSAWAAALGTAFTYQGQLKQDGTPAPAGPHQMTFELYDDPDPMAGALLGTVGPQAVQVTDGLFTEQLDFGAGAFDGNARWLRILVAGTPLSPLQPITPGPYALFAADGAGAGGCCVWQLNGSDIYYDSGNVGIGTSAPDARLHLGSGSLWIGGTDAGGLPASAGAGFRISNSASGVTKMFAYDYTAPPAPRDLILQSPGGRVGIGTSDTSRGTLNVQQSVDDSNGGIAVWDSQVRVGMRLWTVDDPTDGTVAHIDANAGGTVPLILNRGGGKVGIGTTEPGGALDVVGSIRAIRGADPDQFIQMSSASSSGHWLIARTKESNKKILTIQSTHDGSGSPAGEAQMRFRVGAHSAPTEAMRIRESGNVGIGITAPETPLHVGTGNGALLRLGNDPELTFTKDTTTDRFKIFVGGSGWSDAEILQLGRDTGGQDVVMTGNVGIGTTPSSRLHVAGNFRLDGDLRGYDGNGDETIDIDTDNAGSPTLSLRDRTDAGAVYTAFFMDADDDWDGGPRMYIRNDLGKTTIDLRGNLNAAGVIQLKRQVGDVTQTAIRLDANYNGSNKSRIITDVLQINGADLSEQFDISSGETAPEPGMVVSIDPANPGKLAVAREAYDKKVAGIISGAGGVRAGLIMGQEGTIADGEYAVALTGRVWCFVDAGFGAIEPGDQLTTSNTPGHAMKASHHDRARGAVIGKAMTGLEDGTGMVLVLVQPQ